ncbi:hypothetical protein B0H34DRAFT_709902 [Crassisporium funariophilum]|nr:hypothetical protein B0H34DRAFT_709902 [Crassisporium funariophilum]
MVLPELPQELWDSIIDQFHDDKHTLASCSYVCKGFHSTAQKIFYEHTTLSLLSLTSFQLHNLLEHSPYLRPYVRKLTITDHTRALWRRSDGIPESAQSVVASAVSLLDNVVSLSIERRLRAGVISKTGKSIHGNTLPCKDDDTGHDHLLGGPVFRAL